MNYVGTDFLKAASKLSENETILNYVWISGDTEPLHQKFFLSTVPLNRIDEAIMNAECYPDCTVNIWIDRKQLDLRSQFFTNSYIYLEGSTNLVVRDLNDIPAYRDDTDIFAEGSNTPLWSKIDYARLLAVRHCFDETDAKSVFYSDFDGENAWLKDPEICEKLSKHGIAAARSYDVELENSYFAFTDKGLPLLDKIIAQTRLYITDRLSRCGWTPFVDTIDRWFKESHMSAYHDEICVRDMPRSGKGFARNPNHYGLMIYDP